MKPYWKLEKRPDSSKWSTSLLFTNFSKTLLSTERRPLPNILNYRDHRSDETFQQSGKLDYFRHIYKCWTGTCESSDFHFFRTTTGMRLEPDAFDELRFAMTLLIILEVTWILCSFRLVLEGKAGKEILESSRFEFLEKFLANNFALSETIDSTSSLLNRGGIADLPLLRTLLAIY